MFIIQASTPMNTLKKYNSLLKRAIYFSLIVVTTFLASCNQQKSISQADAPDVSALPTVTQTLTTSTFTPTTVPSTATLTTVPTVTPTPTKTATPTTLCVYNE